VEWSDRFAVLPPDRVEVRLAVSGDEERVLDAGGTGERSQALVAAWSDVITSRR
jgi:hypothetical protein